MFLFTFKSRTSVIKFFDVLMANNVSARLINTPRAVTRDCALSVSVLEQDYFVARSYLGNESYTIFHYNGAYYEQIQ